MNRKFDSRVSWFEDNRKILLWTTVAAMISNIAFNTPEGQTFKGFMLGFVWSWLIWTTQWFGNGLLGDWLTKKIPWMERPLLRAITGVVGLVVYSIIAFLLVHIVMGYLIFDFTPIEAIKWIGMKGIQIVLIISGSIAVIIHMVAFFMNWKESQIEAEKLRAEMKTYQYEALRNQINPHFLFNSFNVLSELVYENQELAVKFIRQLSDIYRYVLDSKDLELVSLSEEIKFIKKFSFLLQTRFEENLTIDIEVEAMQEELIVPMSLQLLIENAVKHNEISTDFPLKVVIQKKGNTIQITNSLKKKNNPESSTKTGLQNIVKRYEFLSDKSVIIEESKDKFIVEIPILKSE